MSPEVGDSAGYLDRNWFDANIKIKRDAGNYTTIKDAEAAARYIAANPEEDAVIVRDDAGGYHVYAVDEISTQFRESSANKLYDAPANTVSFVMSTSKENPEDVRAEGTEDPSANVSAAVALLKTLECGDDYIDYIAKNGFNLKEMADWLQQLLAQGGSQSADVSRLQTVVEQLSKSHAADENGMCSLIQLGERLQIVYQ